MAVRGSRFFLSGQAFIGAGFALIVGSVAYEFWDAASVSLSSDGRTRLYSNIPFAFGLVGFGHLLPILVAKRTWSETVGTVMKVEDDEEVQKLSFVYSVNEKIYSGTHSETGKRSFGSKLNLYFDSKNPERYVVESWRAELSGYAFFTIGLFGLVGILYRLG